MQRYRDATHDKLVRQICSFATSDDVTTRPVRWYKNSDRVVRQSSVGFFKMEKYQFAAVLTGRSTKSQINSSMADNAKSVFDQVEEFNKIEEASSRV